jgi:hypothetical protein
MTRRRQRPFRLVVLPAARAIHSRHVQMQRSPLGRWAGCHSPTRSYCANSWRTLIPRATSERRCAGSNGLSKNGCHDSPRSPLVRQRLPNFDTATKTSASKPLSSCSATASRSFASGLFGDGLDLEAGPLDHLFEIGDELPVDGLVGGVEGLERWRAGSVKDREHAELLPNRFIHALGIPVARHTKPLRLGRRSKKPDLA